MRLETHRRLFFSVLLLLLFHLGIPAWNRAEPPAIEALLRDVVTQQLQNIDARYRFRYREEEIVEALGPDGHPMKFDTKLMEWLHTDFDSYVKYLAINGGFYSAALLAEQQAKIEQQIQDAQSKPESQRRALREKMTQERKQEKDFIRSLPEAFRFQYAGEQTINGHLSWVFSFTPRAGFRPPSRETSFLKTLSGKLWITQEEHQLIRLMGTLQEDVSFGGGLFGSVKKGSTITLEQMPLEEGIWLPAFTEMEFRAKVFVKGQNRIEISRYSHYELQSPLKKKIEVEKLP